MRVHVLTISDRASAGVYPDASGAEIETLLREAFPDCAITRELIPDDEDAIRAALAHAAAQDHYPHPALSSLASPAVAYNLDNAAPPETEKISPDPRVYAPADFIITTGGTGISPRDVTPEVTAVFCEKTLPGIAEALRAASLAETNTAMLSRACAGIYGRTIIVNFPGSARACRLCAKTLIPVMEHALAMLRGAPH